MAGAAQHLLELPSRGYFSCQASSNPGGMRVYVCEHDTAPPEEQLIKTDSTNILIRYLTLKKSKADQKGKDNKRKALADEGKCKRPAERPSEDKASGKRVNVSAGPVARLNISAGPTSSRREAGPSRLSDRDLQGYTVQKIKVLLKERGQPLRGNKDELIARLKKSL